MGQVTEESLAGDLALLPEALSQAAEVPAVCGVWLLLAFLPSALPPATVCLESEQCPREVVVYPARGPLLCDVAGQMVVPCRHSSPCHLP